MVLRLTNTLTRTKEAFVPGEPGQVKMYVCGITPYDHSHLGHGRSYVVWDTVRRYLEFRGYQVRYVQNFTDVDDKILRRAQEEGRSWSEVTETYIESYFADMEKLNVRRADVHPRITDSMEAIVGLIGELEARAFAYPSVGDVYYRVRRFPGYGKLSGKRLEDLEAGSSGRVSDEETARKKDPFDFALWKGAAPDEPAWNSPWGPGRPGWHIECSAMLRAHLGDTVDIHAGGEDLQFPHHENEIAQSEAATGKTLARYWMHNGFINVVGPDGQVEKMSKSLGNFVTLRGLFESYPPMAFRLLVLRTSYRKPIVFSLDIMQDAVNAWQSLDAGLSLSDWIVHDLGQPREGDLLAEAVADFTEAMDDDFNTPEALAVLFDLAKRLVRAHNVATHGGGVEDADVLARTWRTLRTLADVLGFAASEPTPQKAANLDASEIEAWIARRQQARAERNWAEADRIRDFLAEQGVVLIDHKGAPTTWKHQ